MEDLLTAIGHFFLGLVGGIVYISTLVVRGIVWLVAILANQFGWDLGQSFVNKVVLGLALLLSVYLGIGYFLLPLQAGHIPNLYSPIIVYPAALLAAITWVGYFCAPSETTDQTGIIKTKTVDPFTKYTTTFTTIALMFIVMIKFTALFFDSASNEREKLRIERCLSERTATGEKLKSLAEKIGIGEGLSEDVGKKLTERCK